MGYSKEQHAQEITGIQQLTSLGFNSEQIIKSGLDDKACKFLYPFFKKVNISRMLATKSELSLNQKDEEGKSLLSFALTFDEPKVLIAGLLKLLKVTSLELATENNEALPEIINSVMSTNYYIVKVNYSALFTEDDTDKIKDTINRNVSLQALLFSPLYHFKVLLQGRRQEKNIFYNFPKDIFLEIFLKVFSEALSDPKMIKVMAEIDHAPDMAKKVFNSVIKNMSMETKSYKKVNVMVQTEISRLKKPSIVDKTLKCTPLLASNKNKISALEKLQTNLKMFLTKGSHQPEELDVIKKSIKSWYEENEQVISKRRNKLDKFFNCEQPSKTEAAVKAIMSELGIGIKDIDSSVLKQCS